jgi:hypothetical protein
MLQNVAEFLSNHPLADTDALSMEEWKRSCEAEWSLLANESFTRDEEAYGSSLLATFLSAYADLASQVATRKCNWSLEHRRAALERLLAAPQIEQRTEAWYLDAVGLLSASQFHTILKPGRTRGLVVLQKASVEPPDSSVRRTCVPTQEMNAFTWGIRFEPIIKQIYQDLTATKVAELGRLRHTTDRRIAASPDGLVVEGPEDRIGRFVEFKAPVTRKLLSIIPEEYMSQMQIQMEVGEVEECDYLEIKFQSAYGSKQSAPSNPETHKYYGNIFLVGDPEVNESLKYIYSPLNNLEWKPDGATILETIPWCTSEWYMKTVGRSRSWFAAVQPAIELFWEDVAKAKRGEFILKESTRKPKEAKCLIVDDRSVPCEESAEAIATCETMPLFVSEELQVQEINHEHE